MKIRASTLSRKLGYSPADWGLRGSDMITIGPNREILSPRGVRMGHLTRAEYEELAGSKSDGVRGRPKPTVATAREESQRLRAKLRRDT